MDKLLDFEYLTFRVQANYIFWKIIESLNSFLSLDIRREFELYEKARGNIKMQKRSDYCFGITSSVYGIINND